MSGNRNSGNDTIFGDEGRVSSIVETGLAVVDKEIAGLSVSMRDLLVDFASLGFAKNALDALPGAAIVNISVGHDTIDGAGGDDTIFGDTGTIVVPASQLTLVGPKPHRRCSRPAQLVDGHADCRCRHVLHGPCRRRKGDRGFRDQEKSVRRYLRGREFGLARRDP